MTLAESETHVGDPSGGRDPASYRDPSGFVYRRDGILRRQINRAYAAEWKALTTSGFLDGLQVDKLLIDHEVEPNLSNALTSAAIAVIRPAPVDFVSYPFEWSFSQLKSAALLTLRIQARAIESGFTLKDASAYNIQFQAGAPVLVDTLSFERADASQPWIAYGQFCEHFLAPLALMGYKDIRLSVLQRDYLDGIPLDLTSHLLPRVTYLRLGLASHIHLHARARARYSNAAQLPGSDARTQPRKISKRGHAALLDSLERTIRSLNWNPIGTEWADYAEHTSYNADAAKWKDDLVREMLVRAGGSVVWDLGANTGRFSKIAAGLGRSVVAWDIDPAASERHVRSLESAGSHRILPLIVDLANPSPSIGWGAEERSSIFERANADVGLALALVHHLAIGRNVPLEMIAGTMARIAKTLVIEFVPKEDAMVQTLLATRRDVFPDYTPTGFRSAFSRYWDLAEEVPILGTTRTLHLMRRLN